MVFRTIQLVGAPRNSGDGGRDPVERRPVHEQVAFELGDCLNVVDNRLLGVNAHQSRQPRLELLQQRVHPSAENGIRFALPRRVLRCYVWLAWVMRQLVREELHAALAWVAGLPR